MIESQNYFDKLKSVGKGALRTLPVVGLSASVAGTPVANAEALNKALSAENARAESVKFDPGKMQVDFEVRSGRGKVSGKHAYCIIMGDVILNIDGTVVDTKGEYKGQKDAGSMTRLYNKDFVVDTTVKHAAVDVLCGPMLPEVIDFMDAKYGDFWQNMLASGCITGCARINANEFGDKVALRSQDPGSMLIDYEPEAGSNVFVSSKHWICSYMGDTRISTPQASFDTKDGHKGDANFGSFTTIDGTNFTFDAYAAGDVLCAPNSIPAARDFLKSKDAGFINGIKDGGKTVVWRTLTPSGVTERIAGIVDDINTLQAMPLAERIAKGVNFNRVARAA